MRRIFSDSFATTVAFFMQRSMAFIRELVLARILGPYYMGLRNTIIMLYNYAPWVQLGSDSEMFRKVALYYDKKPTLSNKYFSTQFMFTIFMSILLSVSVFAFAYFSDYSQEFKYGLYLLSLLVVLRLVGPIITSYLQAAGRFKYTSAVEILVVFLNLILVLALAYSYGWLGALVGLGIPLVVRLILHLHKISDIPLIFDFAKLIELLRGGIRLFVSSISGLLYTQVDSLITVIMLGPAALGIYGIAQTINSFIYGIFGATVQPVGQRMLKAADDEKQLQKYLTVLLTLSSYVMVFPILAIIFVAPYLIDNFIPQFHDSIALVNVLAVASFFNLVSGRIGNYLYAKRMENKITVATLICASINVILNIYLITQGHGILGVAYATSFSYLVYFFLIFYLSGHLNVKVISLLVPLVYLVIMIVFSNILLFFLATAIYTVLMFQKLRNEGILHYLTTAIK